jgi:8-oxo-dGTP pyrophosphatase MutT (NUDIX family)
VRRLDVAAVFIAREGEYFLQLRGQDKYKGAAGLIGSFGGKIEAEERAIEAAKRELEEETSLRFAIERLEEIGTVIVQSDHKLEMVEVHFTAFLLPLLPDEIVEAIEGEVVSMTHAAALKAQDRLTAGTRACFVELIKE